MFASSVYYCDITVLCISRHLQLLTFGRGRVLQPLCGGADQAGGGARGAPLPLLFLLLDHRAIPERTQVCREPGVLSYWCSWDLSLWRIWQHFYFALWWRHYESHWAAAKLLHTPQSEVGRLRRTSDERHSKDPDQVEIQIVKIS